MNDKNNYEIVKQFFAAYKDRGMLKWQGFYLSDHTSVRDKNAIKSQEIMSRRHRESMSMEEIFSNINMAFIKGIPIEVDLAEDSYEGIPAPVISGLVEGGDEDYIYVAGKTCKIEEINAINLIK